MSETPDDRPGRSGTRDDPTANPSAYDDFPMQDDRYEGSNFVGIGRSGPWFFDGNRESFFLGEHDEQSETIAHAGEERDLNPGESVGEALERLGDELGWESLSEWAQQNLEGDDSDRK